VNATMWVQVVFRYHSLLLFNLLFHSAFYEILGNLDRRLNGYFVSAS
jgi:hypothetical protein